MRKDRLARGYDPGAMWSGAVEHAAILQVTARATRADSLMLKVRAQEVRGARRLHGASDADSPPNLDASLIGSAITEASLCGDCLARKTGIPRGQVRDSVTRTAGTGKVNSRIDRCDACLKTAVVYRLGNAARIAGVSRSQVRDVVEDLAAGPVCTKCLATRLRLTLFSVQEVVATLRGTFLVDSIQSCRQCGSHKTVALDGQNSQP